MEVHTQNAAATSRRFQFAALPGQVAAWQIPAAILLATFLAYVDALALGFVFDDHLLILTNDSIRSWRYFPTYFTSHIWSFHYPHLLANYYRPLFLTWLRLNDALFGLHAWGWHLTSVLAHVAVTYLVYRLALRLTRDGWVAAAAGLVFGLHPVHVEAVADITSIQEPLSTFFLLAALLAWLRRREPGASRGWLIAALALAAGALLAKESGMVLPLLVAACAGIYGRADSREAATVENRPGTLQRLRYTLAASIPFWIVVLAYLPLRVWALRGFAHVLTPVSFSAELFTIPTGLLFYLRILVWPSGLSCYYDTATLTGPSWYGFGEPCLVLALALLGVSVWYVRTRRSAPGDARAIAFACLWMGLTLLPVLNFRYFTEGEIAHDRYIYLPSVGFVLLVGLGVRQIVGAMTRFERRTAWSVGLVAGFIIVSGYATARQNLFWSDDLSLNYRAHQIAPHNVCATTSLAAAVAEHGEEGTAVALYQQALAARPDFWQANVNLAYLYYAHGKVAEAARYFARACAANPADGDQFLYLGMAHMRLGRLEDAEQSIRRALLVRPNGQNYHLGLAMALKAEGKLAEAKQEIAIELSEDPQNPRALALLRGIASQMSAEAEGHQAGNPERRGPSSNLN